MRRVVALIALLCQPFPGVSQPVPDASLTREAAAPCEAVAAAARHVGQAAWTHEEAALAPTLRIEKGWSTYPADAAEPFTRAREIAALPAVATAIGASDMATTFVEHLPGTDLYEAFTVQGTLHEQVTVFITARQGKLPLVVATPPSARSGEWTTAEDLGTVDGRPVIVDHGRNEATGLDQDIQLTPWTGDGWGLACRVALTFASAYPVTQRFCGDANVCSAAAAVAGQVARAFDQHQRSDKTAFGFGPQASDDAQTAATHARGNAYDDHPDFPQFGAGDGLMFSFGGDGATPFALVLNGRSYLALIGHDGVGWRTTTRVLLAIFDPAGDAPKPLAGIVVERTIAALDQARVLPPVLAPHQP